MLTACEGVTGLAGEDASYCNHIDLTNTASLTHPTVRNGENAKQSWVQWNSSTHKQTENPTNLSTVGGEPPRNLDFFFNWGGAISRQESFLLLINLPVYNIEVSTTMGPCCSH